MLFVCDVMKMNDLVCLEGSDVMFVDLNARMLHSKKEIWRQTMIDY